MSSYAVFLTKSTDSWEKRRLQSFVNALEKITKVECIGKGAFLLRELLVRKKEDLPLAVCSFSSSGIRWKEELSFLEEKGCRHMLFSKGDALENLDLLQNPQTELFSSDQEELSLLESWELQKGFFFPFGVGKEEFCVQDRWKYPLVFWGDFPNLEKKKNLYGELEKRLLQKAWEKVCFYPPSFALFLTLQEEGVYLYSVPFASLLESLRNKLRLHSYQEMKKSLRSYPMHIFTDKQPSLWKDFILGTKWVLHEGVGFSTFLQELPFSKGFLHNEQEKPLACSELIFLALAKGVKVFTNQKKAFSVFEKQPSFMSHFASIKELEKGLKRNLEQKFFLKKRQKQVHDLRKVLSWEARLKEVFKQKQKGALLAH